MFGPFVSGTVIRLFEILKMFYLRMGWDGWMDGWIGYQKNPLNFLLSEYVEDVYIYLYVYL